MDNMNQIIKQHNAKVTKEISNEELPPVTCNCPPDGICPLGNQCLLTNVVYKADVSYRHNNNNYNKVYIGLTEPKWKKRFSLHKHTFRNRDTNYDTKLSDFIWKLRDNDVQEYGVKWSIMKRAPGYNSISKTCGLCTTEKLMICEFEDRDKLLNERSELVSKCRHQNKFILSNIGPNG